MTGAQTIRGSTSWSDYVALSAWVFLSLLLCHIPLWITGTFPAFFHDLLNDFAGRCGHFICFLAVTWLHCQLIAMALVGSRLLGLTSPFLFFALMAHSTFFLSSAAYFSKSGSWLSLAILLELLDWFQYGVGYIVHAMDSEDWVMLLVLFTLLILTSIRCMQLVLRITALPKHAFVSTTAIAIGVAAFIHLMGVTAFTQRMMNSSFAVTKLYAGFFGLQGGASFDVIRPFIGRNVTNSKITSQPNVRPDHVILIVLDSARADHFRQYGYSRDTFPAVDHGWITIGNAYAHAPSTVHSMKILLSGNYFASLGDDIGGVEDFWDLLRNSGVRTTFITSSYWPIDGLVSRKLGLSHAEHFVSADAVGSKSAERILVSDRMNDFYLDDRFIVKEYQDFRNNLRAGEKSFSLLFFQGTHFPYNLGKYEAAFGETAKVRFNYGSKSPLSSELMTNAYDASIRNANDTVASLLDFLTANNSIERSVILIVGDHGESLGERGYYFHSTHLYNEQVRVPCFIRVGAEISSIAEAIERNEQLVGLIDVGATVLDLLNAAPTYERSGRSLLSSSNKLAEYLLYAGPQNQVAVINALGGKFIYTFDTSTAEHFNLREDPQEQVNLSVGSGESLPEIFDVALKLSPAP